MNCCLRRNTVPLTVQRLLSAHWGQPGREPISAAYRARQRLPTASGRPIVRPWQEPGAKMMRHGHGSGSGTLLAAALLLAACATPAAAPATPVDTGSLC